MQTPSQIATAARAAIIFIALCAASAWASAQNSPETAPEPARWMPSTVGLHIGSKHAVPGFNEVNPGLMLGWKNGLVLGAFENSHSRGRNLALDQRRYTVYGGYRLSTDPYTIAGPLGVSAGVDFLLAYGYKKCSDPLDAASCKTRLAPALHPSAALHMGNTALRIGFTPNLANAHTCSTSVSRAQGKKAGAICVVTFSIEQRF